MSEVGEKERIMATLRSMSTANDFMDTVRDIAAIHPEKSKCR
jgi:hypothetical protein